LILDVMRSLISNLKARKPWGRQALTIVELLVSVAIMGVIIAGLYAMFNHTQKALRGNVTQVDVLESGRATLEMISRELEELAATGHPDMVNLYAGVPVLETAAPPGNFSLAFDQRIFLPSQVKPPLVQVDLDQTTVLRTNVLQELFFFTRHGNHWQAHGYRVLPSTNALGQLVEGAGTLYRFSPQPVPNRRLGVESVIDSPLYAFISQFSNNGFDVQTRQRSTNLHRVAEGVIHFRLTAFDHEGRRFSLDRADLVIPPDFDVKLRREPSQRYGLQHTRLAFANNSLPAFLELEMGVLEPETWRRFLIASESSSDLAQDFLRKRAGQVHLFRQRIPIRTAWQ
jgi:hypothetical protein